MKVFQMMKQNEKKCQKMTQKIATIQCVATCNLVCYNNPSRVMDETSSIQEGKPNVNLWAMGRNILAHGFISIFVPKKKRSKKKNDKPFTRNHIKLQNKKNLTTNKDPYRTIFVNKKKTIKKEKTKTTFYPLVKS